MGLDMYLYRTISVPEMAPESYRKVDSLLFSAFTPQEQDALIDWKALTDMAKSADFEQHTSVRGANALREAIVVRGSDSFRWLTIFECVGYWCRANAIHNWFVMNVQNSQDDCGLYQVSQKKLQELLDISKEILAKPAIAAFTLPTIKGFLFGPTEYGAHYFDNLKDTVKILEEVLEKTDFKRQVIFYHSSHAFVKSV